jgi:hypothetical protein
MMDACPNVHQYRPKIANPPGVAPIDAEFKEVSEPTDTAAKKTGKSVRVIK